jgi:Fe2+ transport system protein FeoA
MKSGEKGRISRLISHPENRSEQRLLELGFLEGSTVELLHEAPFGGDPIAVRVRGATIALRRSEAAWIEVKIEVKIELEQKKIAEETP